MFITVALKTNSYKLDDNKEDLQGISESAHWPLQAGYTGLAIKNLNEYVSIFSHCLVNIQNYQGVEIVGIESPVYLTRFDVGNIKVCTYSAYDSQNYYYYETRRFFFGKIPPKSQRNCSSKNDQAIKYTDKSTSARWTC